MLASVPLDPVLLTVVATVTPVFAVQLNIGALPFGSALYAAFGEELNKSGLPARVNP